MKLFRNLKLMGALAIAFATLSTPVDAFNFGGVFKKISHHAGNAFKGFSHNPIGHMFMQAGKQYATQKIAEKAGPAAGQIAGNLFDNAANSLAKHDHHRAQAEHYKAQGDMKRSQYHSQKADQYMEEHQHHKKAYNDHLEKHGVEGDWDSHMEEHNDRFENGEYDGQDYGKNESKPYDDEAEYDENADYGEGEDADGDGEEEY